MRRKEGTICLKHCPPTKLITSSKANKNVEIELVTFGNFWKIFAQLLFIRNDSIGFYHECHFFCHSVTIITCTIKQNILITLLFSLYLLLKMAIYVYLTFIFLVCQNKTFNKPFGIRIFYSGIESYIHFILLYTKIFCIC